MSFYGDIKRIRSSPYVFDKYYPNRATMEANCATDNVYIGRYVLVKYTYQNEFDKIEIKSSNEYYPNTYYIKNNDGVYELCSDTSYNPSIDYYQLTNKNYINKYEENETLEDGKQVTEEYNENVQIDKQKYSDTFDATVWQKIYTNISSSAGDTAAIEKYILVAELNAHAPRIVLADPLSSPMVKDDTGEHWNVPSISEIASSEDSYVFDIPQTLRLDIGSMDDDLYGKDLINNPGKRMFMYEGEGLDQHKIPREDMLGETHNFIRWQNKYYDNQHEYADQNNNGNIDGKELQIQLYAFGQIISDLYDILYGKPKTEEQGALRPFYTDDIASVISQYDKGLVGILSSIATDAKGDQSLDSWERTLQPGLYYYFTSKWGSADEDPSNFIENIPRVIGSTSEITNQKSHYKIDFSNWTLSTER